MILCVVFIAFLFTNNIANASNDIVSHKTIFKSKSIKVDQKLAAVPMYCTAGSILQHTCPDGFQVNSGILLITFNCETGNIVDIYFENWSSNPQLCQGHGGGIIPIEM